MDLDETDCRVFVNTNGLSENSFLKVEICDEQFRVIPGYSGEACVPVAESGFKQAVAWRDTGNLAGIDGPIRVRVNYGGLRPEDIRVYAVYVSPS